MTPSARGAESNPVDRRGRTPHDYASRDENEEMVSLLEDHGAWPGEDAEEWDWQ